METDGQRREIAVAGDNGEGVVNSPVQQVHGVDDQGHIRGVFPGDIVELLFRLDGQAFQLVLPVFQGLLLPVAVGPLYHDAAIGGDLPDHSLQFGKLGVVRVDQQRDFFQMLHGSVSSPFFPANRGRRPASSFTHYK